MYKRNRQHSINHNNTGCKKYISNFKNREISSVPPSNYDNEILFLYLNENAKSYVNHCFCSQTKPITTKTALFKCHREFVCISFITCSVFGIDIMIEYCSPYNYSICIYIMCKYVYMKNFDLGVKIDTFNLKNVFWTIWSHLHKTLLKFSLISYIQWYYTIQVL